MRDNPNRFNLMGAMISGDLCRFHPENWYTPVEGSVTGLQLEDGSRHNYIVWILYPGECPQTVKLFCRFDRKTKQLKRCRIL